MALAADPAARPGAADPMRPEVARVTRRRPDGPDVVTLWLDWPGWKGSAPGQFNMMGLPGLGEVPISVSGGTGTPGRVMQTIRAVGPVSRALAALEADEALTIRGPYGRPWPVAGRQGKPVLIVAGGLGLAPLRPVIRHFARHRAEHPSVDLVIGARSPADLFFHDEYEDWREAGLSVALTVDHAPPGWPGRVGVVTPLIRTEGPVAAFLCGPEIMMRVSAERLTGHGADAGDIHVSLERNMQCGVGLCGHCQLGPVLLCRDGPVLDWAAARPLMRIEEL